MAFVRKQEGGRARREPEGAVLYRAVKGQLDGRVGRDRRWDPVVKGPLCAEIEGFSLPAGAWVSARDREKLETLCRYGARPAVAESRLVELADGRIVYALKKRWRDGTTAVVMTKAVLMERLCALVPKPRKHLVTYHGVLAPASGLRPQVVPRQQVEEGDAGGCWLGATGGVAGAESVECAVAAGGDGVEDVAVAALLRQLAERRMRARLRVPHGGGGRRSGRRRFSWAELPQRAFGIEVLVCPKCCGVRRVLAAIHKPGALARVLLPMGLSSAVPEQAGCRSPIAGSWVDGVDKVTAE